MQIRKTLKFRLYTNRRNRHLNDTINCAGIAWNHITALQKRNHRLGRGYISKYDMMKHMGKLRRNGGGFAYLQQIGSQALQELCERHDKTYQAFFKWVKNGGPKRLPPKFKKITKYKSFTLKQAGWKLLGGNKIRIGSYVYKFSKSREISGMIKTVTVKRDLLGCFWVCFSVEQEIEINQVSTGEIGGFDFGLKTYLVDHAGKRYESPEFFKQGMANISRCNRALARKQKGSHGRQKAKRALTRAHARIANQRNDWQWKLAYQLTDRFDVLCFEDLNLDGMKRLWGRKVSDLAFNDFLHKVTHHCKLKGKTFVQVDRWEPTTQCCSQCHHQQKLSLNERSFECCQCGLVLDRDQNAAINIRAGGASSAGLGDVRRSMTAIPA
jgi:putative transposase